MFLGFAAMYGGFTATFCRFAVPFGDFVCLSRGKSALHPNKACLFARHAAPVGDFAALL
jgi:hypothetical protein